jgi:glyoxylase-like metal-dependent hydrolase (beta-lactamase superfamily II)
VSAYEIAATGSAEVHVLSNGYVGLDGDDERVSGTLLAALASHGPREAEVTDVVFSHHHPDHTVNAALFPA